MTKFNMLGKIVCCYLKQIIGFLKQKDPINFWTISEKVATGSLLIEAEIGGRRFIRFSTIDRSVLFSDSGQALSSVFTHQKLNFVYHYFFKAQL